MNKRTLHATLSIVLVVASLLACVWPKPKPPTPTSAPTATVEATIVGKATVAPSSTATSGPTATPTPSPTPMPPTAPILMSHQPDRGEELQVNAPLVLTFDQAMDQGSVEKAFAIQPPVAGSLKWASNRVLMFQPEKSWQRESVYRVAVMASAQSQAGLALREEIAFRFVTTGYLEVTEVLPAADASEVAMGSTVTVMFNRPVVALGQVSDMSKLPQPLAFVPPVEGQGEWLNTSISVWRPKSGLLPSTTYKVAVKSGLQDTTGGILNQDYTWSFTTEMPRVLTVSPADEFQYVGPSEVISVTFNQPMDASSVEDKFSLTSGKGQRVAGKFSWSGSGTTMAFTPAAGMVMSTRSGDLDPGVVAYLARTEGMTAEQFYHMVHAESGLMGVSETSSDMRDLLEREPNDVRAAEAVALFCYQAKKWIGALAAALGGLDTLVFAGGIGERSAVIRARICAGLEFLGIRLDPARNQASAPVITQDHSEVTVRIIPTDEELLIAQSVIAFEACESSEGAPACSQGRPPPRGGPMPKGI